MSNTIKKDINSSLKFVYSENNSISVIFHENDLLMGVVGEFNQNLKELEKITNSSIYSRGNSILIKSTSEKNEILKNAIQFLANQFKNNGSIEQKDILSSVDQFMINEIIITSPNDMHVHFRDNEMLKLVVPETDKIYENCIVMPNTIPPITNSKMAKDYKLRINKYIENDLNPLMTLYLTENTDADDMIKAYKNKTILLIFTLINVIT